MGGKQQQKNCGTFREGKGREGNASDTFSTNFFFCLSDKVSSFFFFFPTSSSSVFVMAPVPTRKVAKRVTRKMGERWRKKRRKEGSVGRREIDLPPPSPPKSFSPPPFNQLLSMGGKEGFLSPLFFLGRR